MDDARLPDLTPSRAALRGDDDARATKAAAALAPYAHALAPKGELEVLLLGAALAPQPALASLLAALGAEDLEEALLAAWDEQWDVRAAAALLVLRRGDQLEGPAGDFLLSEIENLDPEAREDVLLIEGALARLARLEPAAALRLAGICAEVSARALEGLAAAPREAALGAWADALAADALPAPPDAAAALALDVLGGAQGERLLALVAARTGRAAAAEAARLARRCLEVILGGAAQGEAGEHGEGADLRADHEAVRGALDALQVPCEDLSRDRWSARLRYRDEFDQWQRAPMSVGLTASRVQLRVPHPYGEKAPVHPQALLERNHLGSLARYSLDLRGVPCVIAEIPRDGFTSAAMAAALEDACAALEHLIEPNRDDDRR
jgi:hypothetical protein